MAMADDTRPYTLAVADVVWCFVVIIERPETTVIPLTSIYTFDYFCFIWHSIHQPLPLPFFPSTSFCKHYLYLAVFATTDSFEPFGCFCFHYCSHWHCLNTCRRSHPPLMPEKDRTYTCFLIIVSPLHHYICLWLQQCSLWVSHDECNIYKVVWY